MVKWPMEVPVEDWSSAARAERPNEASMNGEFMAPICDNCMFGYMQQWAATASAENKKLKRKLSDMERSSQESATRLRQELADSEVALKLARQ